MATHDDTGLCLIDGWHAALLGMVYDDRGEPVPVCSYDAVLEKMTAEWGTQSYAADLMEAHSKHIRLLWVHSEEIRDS